MSLARERAEVRCDKTVIDVKKPANDKRASPSPTPDTSDTKLEEP